MHNEVYPSGAVLALLQSDDVRTLTKEVLQERLKETHRPAKRLFDDQTFDVLKAVCDRLFPQERSEKIALPEMLETALMTKPGVGWRYDSLPPINDTINNGLMVLDAEANHRYQKSFAQLPSAEQDELLKAVQTGDVQAQEWTSTPAAMFFTELLVRLTEAYYSHPFAKDEIGDVSFVDVYGWQQLGLNNIESHDPKPQHTSLND